MYLSFSAYWFLTANTSYSIDLKGEAWIATVTVVDHFKESQVTVLE